MGEVFAININESINDSQFQYLLSIITENKRDQVKNFLFLKDAQRTLYGDIMIRYLACQKLKINNEQLVFFHNEFGKPYLLNSSEFYFNISHSEDWVICVVSKKEIGVDIEKIKPIDLGIAKRFFSKNEYENLLSMPDNMKVNRFFDLWTLKESYIKYKGTGLSMPLDSFCMSIDDYGIRVISNDKKHLFFKQYSLDKGYKLSVCSEENEFSKNIRYLNLKNVIQSLRLQSKSTSTL
ncbi:4'-phosphopantetheinyl transferase family protein [Heyndrickxia sporothermodurans]|uniref:4'-phosphopantetheinyl transferase family protein n=1 Tax=Heyndrickxia sporothermodurans TaxID=46224 RepID=UPI0035DD8215